MLSSVLGEKAMLGLYLANASDRAGERKGFFDGAVQGGRDAVVAQERGAQRAADDEATRMRARGMPDPVVSAYLFKEYFNAAARRELGSGLLDQARFLGDYLSDPARKSGEVIDGLARRLDAALLDDRGALAHVKALRDDLVDFAGADVRRQAMTLGNGAGKVAVPVVEVAVSKGGSAVGGRIVGAGAGDGVAHGVDAPAGIVEGRFATDSRGIDEKTIARIIENRKGSRPDPSSYLSPDYIAAHATLFQKGAARIQPSTPIGIVGRTETWVMPLDVAQRAIAKARGSVGALEQVLGLDAGHLGVDPVLIEIPKPTGYHIPNGNEFGANQFWVPGGFTRGGIPEAVVDPVKPGDYTVKQVYNGGENEQ